MYYNYNISYLVADTLSPQNRRNRFLAWLISLCYPLQWMADAIFYIYLDGVLYPFYDGSTTYIQGDRVIDLDNAVYESRVTQTGVQPKDNWSNIDLLIGWIKVSDDYRGCRERLKYNGQKLTLEYALNKYFRTVFRQPDDVVNPTNSDIFIDENAITPGFFLVQDGTNGSIIQDDNDNSFVNDFIFDDSTAVAINTRTIWIPESGGSPYPGFYSSINYDGQGINRIRSFVDKYNIAGVLYNVQTY